MAVPVLKQGSYLIATPMGALSDGEWSDLRRQLVEQAGRLRSTGVIIDVSTMDVMDSFATRILRDIAQAVRLRGARAVIVGIRPEVAYAMVQLGLGVRLADVATALDLEEGLAILAPSTQRGNTYGG